MIPIPVLVVMFIFYVVMCIVTIEVFTQRKEIENIFIVPSFYLFYTILIAYVIDFVDVVGTPLDVALQTAVFTVAGGIVLTYYFKDRVKGNPNASVSYN